MMLRGFDDILSQKSNKQQIASIYEKIEDDCATKEEVEKFKSKVNSVCDGQDDKINTQ